MIPCERRGIRLARSVAIAACAVLENNCAPADVPADAPAAVRQLDDVQDPEDIPSGRLSLALVLKMLSTHGAELSDDQINRSCIVVYEEACKRTAASQAAVEDPDCYLIWENGPGISAANCRNRRDAVAMFADTVESLCVYEE